MNEKATDTAGARQHDRPHLATTKRAVTYLRVSTIDQVNTDYDPEGISLPAQRAAVQRRAAELGAEIVDEYVEPGRSATTTDRRPHFQEMMARIKADKDVDYVIVYARSRMHRNSIDAAITKRDLRNSGVTLISVTDYTEDSAIGDLVATVLDGVNEYQSRASGADISYKMSQKAASGGAVGKAPLGYLNIGEMFEGREVRTVIEDPERAPLVRMAFELYATGRYGFHDLIDTLTDAGLRTRPTRTYPAGTQISINLLGSLLRNRFYLGYILYKGGEFKGRHKPLIEQELFDRVQEVLDARRAGGSRERVHNHYLKGLLYCQRCKRRLMISRGKSHTGALYFYYRCRGRQEHTCDLAMLPVPRVEAAVLENYATVALPAGQRERITTLLDGALTESSKVSADIRLRLSAQLTKLDQKEDQYVALVGDPDWPQAKIAAQLRKIRDERARLSNQLGEDDRGRIDAGRTNLLRLLDLLSSPQALYREASDKTRQAMNQLFFKRVYLDADGDGPFVASDLPTALIAPFVGITRDPDGLMDGQDDDGGLVQSDEAAISAAMLRAALRGEGLSNKLVERVTGIEPALSAWEADVLPLNYTRTTCFRHRGSCGARSG